MAAIEKHWDIHLAPTTAKRKAVTRSRLRREIYEGLNVVDNSNSASAFIFCGKGGEIASPTPQFATVPAANKPLFSNQQHRGTLPAK